jgi:hypothetical protein
MSCRHHSDNVGQCGKSSGLINQWPSVQTRPGLFCFDDDAMSQEGKEKQGIECNSTDVNIK